MNNSKSVEEYITSSDQWQPALRLLQQTILSTGMTETVKWGGPVYTYENKNIVGIAGFKSYVGLWFHQGALLKDEQKKLINAQEGVTKVLRQWRFNSIDEIKGDIDTIREYLEEAILNQIQGKEIKPAKNKPLIIPEELIELLSSNSVLKTNFETYNLTKKREFTDYISEAKRAETKLKRLEKIGPLILKGEGLHDKYRK